MPAKIETSKMWEIYKELERIDYQKRCMIADKPPPTREEMLEMLRTGQMIRFPDPDRNRPSLSLRDALERQLDKEAARLEDICERSKQPMDFKDELKKFRDTVDETELSETEKRALKEMMEGVTEGIVSKRASEEITHEALKGNCAVYYFLARAYKISKAQHDKLVDINKDVTAKWLKSITKYGQEPQIPERLRMAPQPEKIVYNDPATIVYWQDGFKTVVKRSENEPENKYAAFCAALAKKIYGNNSRINRIVKGIIVNEKKAKKAKKE